MDPSQAAASAKEAISAIMSQMIRLDSLLPPSVKLADVLPTFEDDEMALANGRTVPDTSDSPFVSLRSFYKGPDGRIRIVMPEGSAIEAE